MIDPLVELLYLRQLDCSQQIQCLGVGLHYTGGIAPCISDGIVDAGVCGDVFSQELHSHIHQLQGVQGAPSQLGRHGCVGRHSLEAVADLVVGHGALRRDAIYFPGMPAESDVHSIKHAIPRHESFPGPVFFRRASEEFDGAGEAGVLQVVLQGDGGGQRADPQQIVPAPVSGAVLFHRPLFVRSGRLAETGQRVKFSQKSDHRPALAIGPGKGGGDAGQLPLHLKALLLQRLAIELSGIALVEPGLRVVPQRVAHGPKQRLFFLNDLQRPLLFCRHLLVLLPTAPVSELLEIKYIITDMFRKLWCNYTISMPRLSIEKDSIF